MNRHPSLQSKCNGLVTICSELQLAGEYSYVLETFNKHLFISTWQLFSYLRVRIIFQNSDTFVSPTVLYYWRLKQAETLVFSYMAFPSPAYDPHFTHKKTTYRISLGANNRGLWDYDSHGLKQNNMTVLLWLYYSRKHLPRKTKGAKILHLYFRKIH